jgi:GNAT superfamily N-acetyltransferase
MEIAPAGAEDREAMIGLLGAQLAEHAIELAPAGLAHAVDGVLAEPTRGALLVARVAGRVVGVAYLSFTWALEHGGLVGWLEELYVEPSHRGRGIGAALLDAACARARDAGCAAIDLEVDAAHAHAARLYARRGFRRLGRTRFALRLREP